MNRLELSKLLKEAYDIAKQNGSPMEMMNIIKEAKACGCSFKVVDEILAAKPVEVKDCLDAAPKAEPVLTENKAYEARNENKHPNPFDEEKPKPVKRNFADDVIADMPKQIVENKKVSETFPQEDDEETTVETTTVTTTKTIKRYYHKWTEADEKAILSCMQKPRDHSMRALTYVKSRMSPQISDGAMRTKLHHMGISVKRGKLVWNKQFQSEQN